MMLVANSCERLILSGAHVPMFLTHGGKCFVPLSTSGVHVPIFWHIAVSVLYNYQLVVQIFSYFGHMMASVLYNNLFFLLQSRLASSIVYFTLVWLVGLLVCYTRSTVL